MARRRQQGPPPEAEAWYRDLVEAAREMICTADLDGRFTSFNAAFESLTGFSRADWIGRHFSGLVHPDDLPACQAAFEAAMRHAAGPTVRHRLLRRDGHWLNVESSGTPHLRSGRLVGAIGIVRDNTERQRAEDELLRSQQLLEEAEEVAHIGSWQWDLVSNQLTWSAEAYRLFGVTPRRFKPSFASFIELVHPQDRSLITELNERVRREGGSFAYDARILRSSGAISFVRARGHGVRDRHGRLVRLLGIAQDITDRKHEEDLRRALLNRLIGLHEEERARISRELHDGAGQALAALLMGLRRLEDSRSLAEMRSDAARQRRLVAQAIDDLGRLARGLRPIVLDDLGLRAALERLASDQAWLFGFQVTLDADRLGRRRLPRELETALYRVVQEALANAARHAAARQVRIAIDRDRREIRLSVRDDGHGFDLAHVPEGVGRLGLHGIRERMALVGGRAEIRSKPGAGTTVSVSVPMPVEPRRRRAAAAGARSAKGVSR